MGITINKPAKITISKNSNVVFSNNDGPLILKFNSDPLSISPDLDTIQGWNTAFNLPQNGVPFSRIDYDSINYIVKLYGGSNIFLSTTYFNVNYFYGGNNLIIEIDDQAGCIKSVDDDVFYGCVNLIRANLPAAVSFKGSCFRECEYLTDINFPLLTTAGAGCFTLVRSLTSMYLPSLIYAGDDCFGSCQSLEHMNLPSIEVLGSYCFADCFSLTEVDLPSLLVAEAYCFANCIAVTYINLPSLTRCGDYCFYYCYGVTSLNLQNCVNLGQSTDNDYVFHTWFQAPSITSARFNAIHDYGGGTYEGDIQYLIDTWGLSTSVITWV